MLAMLLSRMKFPEFPVPIGVFRNISAPMYDQSLNEQVADARQEKGEGDLMELLHSGDTWTVE